MQLVAPHHALPIRRPDGPRLALRARRKFLRFFPGGFRKWETQCRWQEALARNELRRLLRDGAFAEVAAGAVRVAQRSRHSMIFAFEKMAKAAMSSSAAAAASSAASSAGWSWVRCRAGRRDWETYASLLEFAARVRRDVRDLRPRDMIDLQFFIWVQGSDEYEE